jgi:hypothetical protein
VPNKQELENNPFLDIALELIQLQTSQSLGLDVTYQLIISKAKDPVVALLDPHTSRKQQALN